jgi:hypothetical protein
VNPLLEPADKVALYLRYRLPEDMTDAKAHQMLIDGIVAATEREAAVEELVKATDELTRAVSIRQMSTVLPEDEYKSEDEYKKAVSDYSDAMFRLVLARNRADTALAALSREVKDA